MAQPSTPRIFTFTYEGKRISVLLPERYTNVALIQRFTPEGKQTSAILMAATSDHKEDVMIAELIKGEWISTLRK